MGYIGDRGIMIESINDMLRFCHVYRPKEFNFILKCKLEWVELSIFIDIVWRSLLNFILSLFLMVLLFLLEVLSDFRLFLVWFFILLFRLLFSAVFRVLRNHIWNLKQYIDNILW